MRLLAALFLGGVVGCSTTATNDASETGEDAITATDTADAVLFTLDNVKAIELTLAPADMQTVSDQANGVAAGRVSVWDDRRRSKGRSSTRARPCR